METVLEVRDVTVDFNGFKALRGLSLTIGPGELRFLIGPNGAGKTTLIDVISGRVRPAAGSVVFKGKHELTRLEEHRIVRLGIGRKFQTPALFADLSVRAHLELAAGIKAGIVDGPGAAGSREWAGDPGRTRRRGLDGLRRLAGYLKKPGAAVRREVDALLERLRLAEVADRPAGSLAHGHKQWLEIGMVLIQEPTLILLDEPVAGMTSVERRITGELLREMAQEHAILVVEHDMSFVRAFSTKVSVLHQGELIKEGSMEEVQQDQRVIDSYLGRAHRPAGEMRMPHVRATGPLSQWERADV